MANRPPLADDATDEISLRNSTPPWIISLDSIDCSGTFPNAFYSIKLIHPVLSDECGSYIAYITFAPIASELSTRPVK